MSINELKRSLCEKVNLFHFQNAEQVPILQMKMVCNHIGMGDFVAKFSLHSHNYSPANSKQMLHFLSVSYVAPNFINCVKQVLTLF